ncbi:hypothetical protein [Mastigocoleus testarum]|uniref:hypothetical protein n=1 Tax=Mastigocoleus testarum TaxID=996925 RepID=UPI00128EEF46|nr:hypothetical protein [Mastigocoleus testarum]
MDGEFVRRKSSRWGNSSKPKSSLFSSRGFTPPEQQIPVEIPEEIPEPVFLKSVLNSRSKETLSQGEQENVKQQGDVSLKSDALEPTDGGELIAQANTPEKSQQDKSKGVGGWLSKPLQWVWGVVQEDFNEDPSISQTVVRTLITLIPGIDQAGDVQDLTAALYKLAWKQQYDEIGPWFDLFITGIGFVPELGSALKGVIKILKKGEDANVAKIGKLLGGLANNLDDFSAFTDIAAKSVKQKISELITHTTQTGSALRLVRLDPTGGKIKQLADKLDNFAQSLEEIRGLVDEKFREIGWEIQRQLDELLGGGKGKLATANGAPLPGKGVEGEGIESGPMRIEGGNEASRRAKKGERQEAKFKNTMAHKLDEELKLADKLGVKPVKVGDAEFDQVVNQGDIKWAVTENGDLVVIPKIVAQEEISHSVLTRGKPVLAAGEAQIVAGNGEYYMLEISNASGHFLPSADSLEIGKKAFMENGIDPSMAKITIK